MKRALVCLAVAALALTGLSAPAAADLCTIEATPAATLLLPYFEVDIDDPNGVDTFFSINNAEPVGILAHVVVWTDMSVEALDFNVFLTGYDVQTIGLGLIIRDGILPETSYDDSPVGAYSIDDYIAIYDQCETILPYVNPVLDEDFLTHLQSILTGGPSAIYGGKCGGYDHGDNIARGYVTVDNVLDCTILTPCDNGYFVVDINNPPEGLVGFYVNALWGDWYMIDYANDFAQGDTLVHVQSWLFPEWPFVGGGAPPPPTTPAENLANALRRREQETPDGINPILTQLSFWGRCNTVFHTDRVVEDAREPLPTTWASRFYQNAAFTGGTDFLVWRDSLFNNLFGEEDGFSCSSGPDWFPLNERQVVFFDEEENPEEVCTISPCPEQDILFPLEAQRVSVADLDITPESGWAYMNLNQLWFVGEPVVFAAQSWVNAVHSASGRFSAGLPAIQLDSMCDASSILIGPYGPDFPAEEYPYLPFSGLIPGGAPVAGPGPANPID